MISFTFERGRWLHAAMAGVCAWLVVGCAGSSNAPKPAELGPNAALLGIRQAWVARLDVVGFPLEARVVGAAVTVASSSGQVAAIDGRTGVDIWRVQLANELSAGVGTDGVSAAVVTRENELVILRSGKEAWRQKLAAQVFTAPLVAGNRVFVALADRSVAAFDAQTGRRLWVQDRPADALVLRQTGLLQAVGDTLVVGLGGRLVGMNSLDGSSRWEVPIASPRGANEIERLVDLVAGGARNGGIVCVRAFQAAIGCVDAERGKLIWSKATSGFVGLSGDDTVVYGTESDGKIVAWKLQDGEQVWATDLLRYRRLTAPFVIGRSIAVGDGTGLVHLLSRVDGTALNRLSTDGTAIAATPVQAGGTLVVVTRGGGVFGFRPE